MEQVFQTSKIGENSLLKWTYNKFLPYQHSLNDAYFAAFKHMTHSDDNLPVALTLDN